MFTLPSRDLSPVFAKASGEDLGKYHDKSSVLICAINSKPQTLLRAATHPPSAGSELVDSVTAPYLFPLLLIIAMNKRGAEVMTAPSHL